MANIPKVSESYETGEFEHSGTKYIVTWKPLGFMGTTQLLDKAKQSVDGKTGDVRVDLTRLSKEWLLAVDAHVNGEKIEVPDIMAMTADFGSVLLDTIGFHSVKAPSEADAKK